MIAISITAMHWGGVIMMVLVAYLFGGFLESIELRDGKSKWWTPLAFVVGFPLALGVVVSLLFGIAWLIGTTLTWMGVA